MSQYTNKQIHTTFRTKSSTYPDPCTISGNDFAGNLQIGLSHHQLTLTTSSHNKRRSEVSAQTAEDIGSRFGTRDEIRVTFQSDNGVILSHIRRNRIHSNSWLDTFAQYNDEEFKREFSLSQWLIYKSHLQQYGKFFRWGLPKRTFKERDMGRQHKPLKTIHTRSAGDYLPADREINYLEIDIRCMAM